MNIAEQKLFPICPTILQTKGLAMDAPTSTVLAEIYIQKHRA
jgi:hypothetical protein